MHLSRRLTAILTVLAIALPLMVLAAISVSSNQLFSDFESQEGLPPGILGKIAMVESGGNQYARAQGTSAAGMFQWLSTSWQQTSYQMMQERRHVSQALDPRERFTLSRAAEVTAYALSKMRDNIGGLIKQAGVDMTVGLYLGHFLGQGGASQFLHDYIQNPGGSAAAAFSKAAAANQSIFYGGGKGRSFSEVINELARRLSQPGVVNIAGNFSDAAGNSLAVSGTNMVGAQLLPEGFIPPTDNREVDYQDTSYQQYLHSHNLTPSDSGVPQDAPPSQQNPSPATPASTAQPPADSASSVSQLVIQPKSVSLSSIVVVSWTSVNMNASSPCTVTSSEGITVGQGREGTVRLQASTIGVGNHTYLLTCTDQKAVKHESSSSVTVVQ